MKQHYSFHSNRKFFLFLFHILYIFAISEQINAACVSIVNI